MNNWKEFLIDLASFIMATIVMSLGVGLVAAYIKADFGVVAFIMGLIGFLILYPAFKSWQDRFKDLF